MATLQNKGRSLKLYLVDGTPSGVVTAELGVSTVRAVMASRTVLPELIARPEAGKTGIYVLLGADPEFPDRLLAYIGESDEVRIRLIRHDDDERMDFFSKAIIVVLKDENLTKAHGRYLESRLITAVGNAGRAKLVNATAPPLKGLPESDVADMEMVLDEISVLLPILGFDILRPVGHEVTIDPQANLQANVPSSANHDALFVFTEAGTRARARESGDEFVVLAGSMARNHETPSCGETSRRRRLQLLADGQLVPEADGKLLRFTRDVPFESPSGAASVIYGGSVNGRHYWRHAESGRSYKEWRALQIVAADGVP